MIWETSSSFYLGSFAKVGGGGGPNPEVIGDCELGQETPVRQEDPV